MLVPLFLFLFFLLITSSLDGVVVATSPGSIMMTAFFMIPIDDFLT